MCTCRFIFCSGSLDIVEGQPQCQLFVLISSIDNAVLQIDALFDALCMHPNIQVESNINSKVQYLSIGSLLSLK